jgi:hypothetical protein
MNRLGIALLLGSVAGLLAAAQPLADTDMWWQLATGRETLAHGIVRADIFSWTVRGASISTDQWLGQIVMYASYLVADWRGIATLRVVLVIALVVFVALNAARSATRPLALVLATLPAVLLTRAVWVDRPELFGLVLFAALLVLLRVLRDDGDGRRALAPIAVVLLIGVWANIHGSFALGAVITLLACLEGALRDVPRRRTYIACALAAIAVTLATPSGIGAWTAPGSHFLSPPRDIQEWSVIDVRTPLGVAYVVTLGLFIASLFLGPRLPVRDLVILLPVAFLSLTAARQAPLLAIAAAPLFAARAQALLARARARSGSPAEGQRATEGPRAIAAISLAASAVLMLVAVFSVPTGPDERAYPREALASIPTGDGTLARYEWGGWLIWSGVPVFVDGRLTPYSGGILDDYRRIIAAAPGWQEALARRRVRTLLVVPSDAVAIRAAELGWTVRARSKDFVLIAVP